MPSGTSMPAAQTMTPCTIRRHIAWIESYGLRRKSVILIISGLGHVCASMTQCAILRIILFTGMRCERM